MIGDYSPLKFPLLSSEVTASENAIDNIFPHHTLSNVTSKLYREQKYSNSMLTHRLRYIQISRVTLGM